MADMEQQVEGQLKKRIRYTAPCCHGRELQ